VPDIKRDDGNRVPVSPAIDIEVIARYIFTCADLKFQLAGA
jgi:hypothetical protein